ncbi:MAG: nascent polypeptide-associated complex protein [Desulfurococcaceae archaeon]
MFINPHELKKLLKRYGIEVEELKNIEKVELYMESKKIVISHPQVLTYKVPGQVIYQIMAQETREEPLQPPQVKEEKVAVSEEDIRFIIEYTGTTREKAIEALIKAGGDLAKAIMIIRGESRNE